MSQQYEIEIKSLLGNKDKADELIQKLQGKYPNIKEDEEEQQLNHYFNTNGDFAKLEASLLDYFSDVEKKGYEKITKKGRKFSIRTRDTNGTVLFVIKASVDDTTSENGITRIEFEVKVPLSIDELDQKVIDAGFTYQAKWSRRRNQYIDDNVTVCIDKNAGYGYVAEFEKVIADADGAGEVRNALRGIMDELGVEELAQDRLERMFAFYNDNWNDYYGTDKTFTIE
jgi:adenylate cyclase class IV